MILAATAILLSAFRLNGLGFYDDDWAWFSLLARAPDQSWLGLARHFAEQNGGVWARPLNFVLFPGLFKLFGLDPLPYHVLLAAAQWWGADAFRRWLEEEGFDRPTALLAGLLFLLWPNHDATRHWVALMGSPIALALTLEALRLRRRAPWAAAGVFLTGGLLYEAAAPLALVPAVLAWKQGWRKALRASAALLGAVVVLVVWQRVVCPLWLHPQRHPLTPSLGHALGVAWSGLECQLLNRLWHLLWRQAAWAAGHFGAAAWAAWLGAAAAAGWAARGLAASGPAKGERLLLGGALLALGYALYALDAGYSPVVFSVTNRINLVPALGAALLAAAGLRRHAAAAAVLPGVLLLAGWSSNGQWAAAAERQREVLDALGPALDTAPAGPKTVLLFGVENFVASAPVFNSPYDIDGALNARRRDPSLRALTAEGRTVFEEKAAVVRWFGDTPLPYRGLYAWSHPDRKLVPLNGRAAGEAFLAGRGR